MKVAELEKGMLLECDDKDLRFIVTNYGDNAPWLRVGKPIRRPLFSKNIEIHDSPKFVMYLGTKKDVDLKCDWSNRFVLVGTTIAAVDPPAWRNMRIML